MSESPEELEEEPGEEKQGGTTSAEDVEADGPLDADEGDPQVDSYPG